MSVTSTADETISPYFECSVSPSFYEVMTAEVRSGLQSRHKSLSPWLFYDAAGSDLFEQITELPEYYLTRTERGLFHAYADQIIAQAAAPAGDAPAPMLTLIELGAGTASKTGLLLKSVVRHQRTVVYQPVDVSESALAAAAETIRSKYPAVTVRCQVSDYTSEPLHLSRLPNTRILALYIGSSIGNFSPGAARSVLRNLRGQLLPGDKLLLGTDLGPGASKSVSMLEAAYDDRDGVTAAFNRNILVRLNKELGANFRPECFSHRAIWNPGESRIEMHLVARHALTVTIPANCAGDELVIPFREGESIHTENSYKFSCDSVERLLHDSGFSLETMWQDESHLFAVNLGTAI